MQVSLPVFSGQFFCFSLASGAGSTKLSEVPEKPIPRRIKYLKDKRGTQAIVASALAALLL